MSILIKGMEMPKSCGRCMFSRRNIHNIDWCVLTEKDLPCDCPLVPIPPHGRLIDADAFERRCMFDPAVEDMQDVIYALRDYPTIIPAEEGE